MISPKWSINNQDCLGRKWDLSGVHQSSMILSLGGSYIKLALSSGRSLKKNVGLYVGPLKLILMQSVKQNHARNCILFRWSLSFGVEASSSFAPQHLLDWALLYTLDAWVGAVVRGAEIQCTIKWDKQETRYNKDDEVMNLCGLVPRPRGVGSGHECVNMLLHFHAANAGLWRSRYNTGIIKPCSWYRIMVSLKLNQFQYDHLELRSSPDLSVLRLWIFLSSYTKIESWSGLGT